MELGLEDKRALILGGSSGIGLATAELLLEEGATVVIAGDQEEELEAALNRLRSVDEGVRGFVCDVKEWEAVRELESQVRSALGDVEIMVYSAGITGPQGPFEEIDEEGWMGTLQTNLLGAVRVTRAFLPGMRRRGWGRLVYLASEDATQPYAEELPYCAAKGGLLSFAKGLSKSVAQDGILVNSVSPAFIATPMTDRMMEARARELGVSFEEAVESFLAEERPNIELKRRGRVEEVASVIAFLCSERASFVNGSNYRVDGGSVATI